MNYAVSQTPMSTAVTDLYGESAADGRLGPIPKPATLRVLLVDDCPVQQRDVCVLLFRWGIKPLVASTGVRAVKLCREQMFDAVLMDIAMPIMDGLEATRLIRCGELAMPGCHRCPIIAYTSRATSEDKMLWKQVGIDDVLIKPAKPEQMAACLIQWCGGAKLKTSCL